MSIRLAGFSPALQNLIKNPATLYGATAVGGAGLGALVEKIRSGVVTPEDQDREGQRAAPPTRASTESKPPVSQDPKLPTVGETTAPAKQQDRGELERAGRDKGIQDLLAQIGKQSDPAYRAEIIRQNLEAQRTLGEETTENYLRKQAIVNAGRVEQENVKAWRDITTAQYNRDATLAMAMAQTAYLAATPNVSVMEALNAATKAGAAPFQSITVKAS
jgi:hypothetical protein